MPDPTPDNGRISIHPAVIVAIAIVALTVGLCCGIKIGSAKAHQSIEGR